MAARFEDRLPFKDRAPDEVHHAGISPTAEPAAEMRTADPEQRLSLVGRPAEYRLMFRSMLVPGLPDEVQVGRVRIVQADGPIWTQQTHIVQQPGWRPVYRKWMEHIPVGAGYRVTVCILPVELTENLSLGITAWRDECLAALSLVVALFDERIAQAELAEDVITESNEPRGTTVVIDHRVGVREFQPTNRVLSDHLDAVAALRHVDTHRDDPVFAAARWYLKAAQEGPSPDAIVYLWISLEALSKPRWGTKEYKATRKEGDVALVERAIAATGFDLALLNPDIGRLAGLRAEIVHGGVEAPALLRPGFYTLEAMTRLLLRARLGVSTAAWPLQPAVPDVRSPLDRLARLSTRFRKIIWTSSPRE
jgi:hypothetical protein